MNAADLAAERRTKLATYAHDRYAALTIAQPAPAPSPVTAKALAAYQEAVANAVDALIEAHAKASADVWLIAAAIDAVEACPDVRAAEVSVWSDNPDYGEGLEFADLRRFVDADGQHIPSHLTIETGVALVIDAFTNAPIWDKRFTREDGDADLAAAIAFVDALPQP